MAAIQVTWPAIVLAVVSPEEGHQEMSPSHNQRETRLADVTRSNGEEGLDCIRIAFN